MTNRWPELDTRFKQYTDLTPEQIDVVREQVLIVLADEGQWPLVVEGRVETKTAESVCNDIHKEIRQVIDRLEGT